MIHRWRMRRILLAYSEGSLSPRRHQAMTRHLQRCTICRKTLDSWTDADRLLQDVCTPVPRLSTETADALFQRALAEAGVKAYRPFSRRNLALGGATLACAATLSAIWLRPHAITNASNKDTQKQTYLARHGNLTTDISALASLSTAAPIQRNVQEQRADFFNSALALEAQKMEPQAALAPAQDWERKLGREGVLPSLNDKYLSKLAEAGKEAGVSHPRKRKDYTPHHKGVSTALASIGKPVQFGRRDSVDFQGRNMESDSSARLALARLAGAPVESAAGSLFVVVTREAPISLTVTYDAADSPGYARAACFQTDQYGGNIWSSCTVSSSQEATANIEFTQFHSSPEAPSGLLKVAVKYLSPAKEPQEKPGEKP